MKVKKEYVVLLAVIVALGLYLAFRSTDRTTYNLPDIPDLNATDLTKIEIRHGDQTVTLTRQEDGWRVSPGDYPADARLVNRMIDDLANLTVTALVSESQNYARYDLDDKHQIRVTAYQGDKAVRTFDIGKAADTMRHTHIILTGDPNVYHARGNFRNDFDQTVGSLRDKSVLAFKPDAVTEFTVETADRSFTLKKIPTPKASQATAQPETDAKGQTAPEATWQLVNGTTVDNKQVTGFLTDLSGLKCRAYLADRSKTDFSKPTYLIRIQSGTPSTLEIFVPADEKANEVPARSSLRRDPFTLSDFDLDPIKNLLTDLTGDEKETKADAGGSTSP